MFVVVMETIMDIGVFLDVTPCSLEKTNRFLEELAARILYYKYRNSRLWRKEVNFCKYAWRHS